MAVRVFVDGQKVGRNFERGMIRQAARVRELTRKAVQEACKRIERRGRADISRAGRFGTRWTEGFTAVPTEGGGNTRITVREEVPYWSVFQHGAVIRGRPLLWIPLSFASDAQRVRASNYPGGLFRVNRRGKAPLLLTPGKPAQVKYFGIASVTIPKKFHLIEITREVVRELPAIYRQLATSTKRRA